MSTSGTTPARLGTLVRRPSTSVGYLAVVFAAVTALVHLALAPGVLGFNQTLGILFALNGLGALGGIALYFSQYWRRELFLVAAGYALVTIVAFFAWGGPEGLSAFYVSGELNPMAVVAKSAEGLLVIAALYLYRATEI